MPAVSTRRRLRQRRWLVLIAVLVGVWFYYTRNDDDAGTRPARYIPSFPSRRRGSFNWSGLRRHYPIKSYIKLPQSHAGALPGIQTVFGAETVEEKETRLQRQAAVKEAFQYAWAGYKEHAYGDDEVIPIGGGSRTSFGGWAATLVDSLDTLWIMDLKDEFREAVEEVAKIDFTVSALPKISTFETTIRYLGGLLAAYDLSHEKVLLQQATDLGEMLYKAFDTPNNMPITDWEWQESAKNAVLKAPRSAAVAEIGSMSMEFTRLSQLTRDNKYFDVVQRITNELAKQQSQTRLPGMFPSYIDPEAMNFTNGEKYTVNALADSLYEYMPKQHLLLGGGQPEYMQMYDSFLKTAQKYAFFRAMNHKVSRIQFTGVTHVNEESGIVFEPEVQHLGCFAGGMVALGARLRDSDAELKQAYELMHGCLWAYELGPQGIMPEAFRAVVCPDDACKWNGNLWREQIMKFRPFMTLEDKDVNEVIDHERLLPGISAMRDRRYLLRPEAIESVFVLYRTTGEKQLMDRGWEMFAAIDNRTRTEIAHSALEDVTLKPPKKPKKLNKMESFWTGETLKYFYLLFSDPDLISLDEWVLNTEAHPFRYRRTV